MNYLYSDKNIIACSTGNKSNVAIALIRISGYNILAEISQFVSISIDKIKPRYCHFCKIIDGDEVLDEVVLSFYKGPNSYNGEDIVELSVHGNTLNVERIIDLFVQRCNIQRANPGEFTYRALRNKKLSLTQVEGLDLFLNASSVFALDQGFSLLSGKLQKGYTDLYDKFLEHRASLELGFDFLEDVGEEAFERKFSETLKDLANSISRLKSHIDNSSSGLLTPEVCLVGQPNAGKSSLFNSLLNDERSIVSSIAGTTRDYISADFRIEDTIFSLLDTAGIRSSEDVIEEKGIGMALDLVKTAFYKILVVNPFEVFDEYFDRVRDVKFDLLVFTHRDVEGFEARRDEVLTRLKSIFGPIEPKNAGPIEPKNAGPIEPKNAGPIEPKSVGPIEPAISYLDLDLRGGAILSDIGDGINRKYLSLSSHNPLILDRHRGQIASIYGAFLNYSKVVSLEEDISIIASELNIVGHCISELIGIVSPDDVLGHIFSNFCIGK